MDALTSILDVLREKTVTERTVFVLAADVTGTML